MIPLLSFHPPVIAHRGACAVAPENTMASIRVAHERGANWVELDVKISYDGVPFLMHDETLERTTNGQGSVADASWETLSHLDAGGPFNARFKGEPVPRLNEAVEYLISNKMSLVMELKPCPGRAKATTMVTMIELSKLWPEGDTYPMIASFDSESLIMAAQLEPHWPRCLVFREWDPEWRSKMADVKACAVSVEESILTKERVEAIKSLRLPLLAYVVNDPTRAKELLAWGVSAVYADEPRAILGAL